MIEDNYVVLHVTLLLIVGMILVAQNIIITCHRKPIDVKTTHFKVRSGHLSGFSYCMKTDVKHVQQHI